MVSFENEFTSALLVYPDPYGIARYLEPHLPLIKLDTLTKFYYDLRYNKGTYLQYVPLLIQTSITDYRLRRVLEQCMEFMSRFLRQSKS